MMLLVSGMSGEWARAYRRLTDRVGCLVTPRGWNKPETILSHVDVWAMDNDCFQGLDREKFMACLERWKGARVPPKFVACPDVVGDAAKTLAWFEEWEPVVRGHGYPVALVAQDGLTPAAVPWGRIEALFVGGSTAWKIGAASAELCAEAKRRGKWLHFGRVNSLRRMEIAARYGCDSVDGSGFSRWRKLIEPGVRWLIAAERRAKAQPELF